MKLSIVIPEKNEPYLEKLLPQLSREFRDVTHEILLQHERGFSNAIKCGVSRAKGEYVAVMDADGAHSPVDLRRMYNLLLEQNKKLILAVRNRNSLPTMRRYATKLFGWIANTQNKWKYADPMSTFLIGKRDVVQFNYTNHSKFTLEILENLDTRDVIEYNIIEGSRLGGKSKTNLKTAYNLLSHLVDLNKTVLFLLILFALIFAISITLAYDYPIGWDWWFHRRIAEIYASGEIGMFSEYVLQTIHYPYPPFFHILLTPSASLGVINEFGKLLQTMLYPLGLATMAYLVKWDGLRFHGVSWKRGGSNSAMLTIVLLMSSLAFFDRLFQPIPQAIDMILFPLVVVSYLKGRDFLFILLSSILVYNHGFASTALLGGVMLHALFNRKARAVTMVIGLTLPILIPSFVYIVSGWGFWGSSLANTPQESWFWANPLGFSAWYLGPLIVAIPLAIYLVPKWKSLLRLEQISLLTLLSLLPMIIPWPDRFLTYITIPLSILMAYRISMYKKRRALYSLLFVGWFIFQLVLWSWLFTDNFYVVDGI